MLQKVCQTILGHYALKGKKVKISTENIAAKNITNNYILK